MTQFKTENLATPNNKIEKMEECLDEIAVVLMECGQLTERSDLSAVDRVALSLKSICNQLGFALVTGNMEYDEEDVNQLHTYLCQMCLEYETRLMFLLTLDPSQRVRSLTYGRRGRPKKVINLSFVS